MNERSYLCVYLILAMYCWRMEKCSSSSAKKKKRKLNNIFKAAAKWMQGHIINKLCITLRSNDCTLEERLRSWKWIFSPSFPQVAASVCPHSNACESTPPSLTPSSAVLSRWIEMLQPSRRAYSSLGVVALGGVGEQVGVCLHVCACTG